jgi:cyclopropane fatty-acyl-phospholipid synthase-like methyltransferase
MSWMSSFNDSYRGVPPWDIGRPQREFVRLADSGEVKGENLIDIGCGTGEHTILFASRGLNALGVDSASLAIEKARRKSAERGSSAKFMVYDCLSLASLGRKFSTAVDSGLFHIFPDKERRTYVRELAETLTPGGNYFMLCFSDEESDDWGGPRRISQAEIGESFSTGWRVNYIRRATIETNLHADGGRAWFTSITRLD